ncbi:MAG: Gfo/Idh/MocA family oxidoreductase [Gemmatimonadetes bacterium]|nr:Gfo/Idh/MocA family oxidoreductase [Gemmatimonadota bacterium]
MKICLVGEGAQGLTHIKALRALGGIEIVSLAGGLKDDTEAFAKEWEIPKWTLDYEEAISQTGVEAVVLTSPNHVHAEQTITALESGKHVLLELPMGLNLVDSQRVVAAEKASGKVAMVCHTQRFNPPFRKIKALIEAGELDLHHIDQQTYFFRRINENRFGRPRTWVDDLLWHQACHMVDMIYWLLEDPKMDAWGRMGPLHPTLNIPMDIAISLQSAKGTLVTAAQSFNNHGPIYGHYRFVGEQETYVSDKRGLTDHEGNAVAVDEGPSGVDLQDAEFIAAIRENRLALTSCSACLPVMETIDRIQRAMNGADGAPSMPR